jgi:glycosyltransferase involved in cell wall biosynthesis
MEASMGRISLIIPTVGRPYDLDACLKSIEREADDWLAQIVVVDDGAVPPVVVPDTLAGVPVRCLRNQQRRGAAYSRNFAMSVLPDGVDAVGFIDDDARLCPNWLRLARHELTSDRGAITGPVRRFDSDIVARARQLRYDRRYAALAAGQAVSFLAGGNSVVWRHLFERAGGFPDVPTMSDRLFLRRLEGQGLHCHFVPDMYVLHRNSKGMRAAVREAWRAGQIDDSPQNTNIFKRLSSGLSHALAGPDIAAGLLNVALDAVFLGGRAWARRRLAEAHDPAKAVRAASSDSLAAAPAEPPVPEIEM